VAAEREWWRRGALVLRRPREVFTALRDDSDASAAERQDAVTALAFVGGVAAALATARGALDDLSVPEQLVWIFITGLAYGFVGYWVVGWGLAFVVPRLGGGGTRRRTRHVLAVRVRAPRLAALRSAADPARGVERRAPRPRAAGRLPVVLP
jgi:hypothetical protein